MHVRQAAVLCVDGQWSTCTVGGRSIAQPLQLQQQQTSQSLYVGQTDDYLQPPHLQLDCSHASMLALYALYAVVHTVTKMKKTEISYVSLVQFTSVTAYMYVSITMTLVSHTCMRASLCRHCSSHTLHLVSSSAKSRLRSSSCYQPQQHTVTYHMSIHNLTTLASILFFLFLVLQLNISMAVHYGAPMLLMPTDMYQPE